MSIFVHRKSKTGPLTLSTHHLSEGLDNHRTLTCLRHLSFWRLVDSFQAIKFSLLGMTKSKKGRLLPQWPQKVRVSQRKLLRATVKLFGNGAHLGLGTRAGLLPQQEASWLETTIASRAEYFSQDLNTDNYFDSADALSEEEEERWPNTW